MLRKLLAVALFALLSTTAQAASRVWISEFSTLGSTDGDGNPGFGYVAARVPSQIAALPAVTRQQLDISVSVQSSAAFNSKTRYIRIVCEVQCAVRGDGTTATTADTFLPALSAEYFGVVSGSTISVIAAP